MRVFAFLPSRLLHVGAVLSVAATVSAQPAPTVQRPVAAAADSLFTADDGLDIVSYNALDLTSDGRWLVATSQSRRDGLGVDYRRDGDPTYIRPAASRVWVIDTRSGATRAIYPDKRNVRAARWSPDGSRLALLVLDAKSGAYQPVIWD